MIKHLNIKIYGKVQGVFFRYTAKEQANEFGIFGFARNEEDGSVYIEAEGEEENLDKFIKWCHVGPTMADVKKVEATEGPLKNFFEFAVY